MAQATEADLDTDFLALIHDAAQENPYALYRRMREHDPVHWCAPVNAWVATSYEAVERLTMDDNWSSSESSSSTFQGDTRPYSLCMIDKMVSHVDAPDHTRLRKLTKRTFSVRVAESRRAMIAELARKSVEALGSRTQFDFQSDLAFMYPLRVTCHILGLPLADIDRLRGYSLIYRELMEPVVSAEHRAQGDQMFREFGEYLREFMDDRRKSGDLGDDVLADFMAAENDGELEYEELVASFFNIMHGSHETTANTVGNGVHTLLSHPDQWQLLIERPDLVKSATEEILRYCASATNTLPRWALEDSDLCGKRIAKGQKVVVCVAAANRDPGRFPDPDRFDITRESNQHVGFGRGKHLCLGAPFARVEIQEMLSNVISRMPSLRPDGPVEWTRSWGLRGLASFPVRVG